MYQTKVLKYFEGQHLHTFPYSCAESMLEKAVNRHGEKSLT